MSGGDRLGHGAVTPKPGIARRAGDRAELNDGTTVEAFPFFDTSSIAERDDDLPLFFRVFHPKHTQLAFTGLLQPLGAIMPIAEAQEKWLAKHLRRDIASDPLAMSVRVLEF